MSLLLKTLALCLAAAAPLADAAAAPPPPVIAPDALKQPVEGYDLGTVYQKWRYWVESHKGAAADEQLKQPETIEGEEAFGEPLLRFAKHNDFGHFLTGEIRLLCRARRGRDAPRRDCHYRLRRAFVPHDAADPDGRGNPVARWMRDSFDAAKVVRHLRASGLGPDTDWWMTDSSRLFSPLPSPLPMLIDNAKVVRLDSRECPDLRIAIEALESRRLDWRVDMLGVGADQKLTHSQPHAERVVYTLSLITPEGGRASVEGRGPDLARLIEPLMAAADQCEAANPPDKAAG